MYLYDTADKLIHCATDERLTSLCQNCRHDLIDIIYWAVLLPCTTTVDQQSPVTLCVITFNWSHMMIQNQINDVRWMDGVDSWKQKSVLLRCEWYVAETIWWIRQCIVPVTRPECAWWRVLIAHQKYSGWVCRRRVRAGEGLLIIAKKRAYFEQKKWAEEMRVCEWKAAVATTLQTKVVTLAGMTAE